MSIAIEITRLQGAKADLKQTIESVNGVTIPDSTKLDQYPNYIVPPGCYVNPPTANGVYIKYVGGFYSDYNVFWTGKTPVGVCVKTDGCSLCMHPSEGTLLAWCTSNVTIAGVTSVAYSGGSGVAILKATFTGKADTAALLASSYSTPAAQWARNATYADGSIGWLPSGGEFEAIYQNVVNVNAALSLIGGTQILRPNSYGMYRVSNDLTDYPAQGWSFITYSQYGREFWTGIDKNQTRFGSGTSDPPMRARSVTDF